MVDTGQLVDENGNKITDLSKISFEDTPLDKSTSAIVDAIDKLRQLFEQMPAIAQQSAEGIGRAYADVHPNVDVGVHWKYDDFRAPEGDFGGQMAEGGYGTVDRPTWFLAGEAGREQYAFSGANRTFSPAAFASVRSDAAAGGTNINVSIGQVGLQESEYEFRDRVGKAVVSAMRAQGVRFSTR
jgi:hypothetical protein